MLAGALLSGLAGGIKAEAQDKLAPAARVTYDNKYELYGGPNFMNFQAGQNEPKRMNMGGMELLGTYWLTKKVGLGLDFRGDAGSTPVLANPYVNRPTVELFTLMAGAQVRGPKNHYAALNYHGYAGLSHGIFDVSTGGVPAQYANVGLYTNRTKPMAALGASVDFNRSKNMAIRIQPDLILEHFGTETREFFSISLGVVYRYGKK